MSKADWVWMPHPGHLCIARECQFRLSTYVNGYIVSTVGEFSPSKEACQIMGVDEGSFFEIGLDRKYETMVFPARRTPEKECPVCPWQMADASEIDFQGYNDPKEAYEGHLAMCEKYDQLEVPK